MKMELKELIEKRWQSSAEGYSASVQKELVNIRNPWRDCLQEHMSIVTGTKILDIGCGPGFFSIILSGKDHETIGIDGSENMILEAVKNAEKEHANASFHVMDCHHLQFEDNTFDYVVSRNVVWTLYDPAAAYKEWKRVLKPGGKILVFDAAWNREFHDEKLMARKQKEREDLGLANEPLYFGNQSLADQLDRRSVLGAEDRPNWDEEVLKSLGLSVAIDKEVWKTLWDDNTSRINIDTPMFLIVAKK